MHAYAAGEAHEELRSPILDRENDGDSAVERIRLSSTTTQFAGQSTAFEAGVSILCTVVGAGVLQLPSGLEKAGWLGLVMFFILAAAACYTGLIIGRMMKAYRFQTFEDMGQAAYGDIGRWIVTTQMNITLVGVATIYIVLAGGNLQYLLKYIPEDDEEDYELADIDCMAYCMMIVGAFVMLHIFMRTLHDMTNLSYFNAIITLSMVLTALIEIGREIPDVDPDYKTLRTGTTLGSAFASFSFSFSAHPVLPTVYNNMKDPSQYSKTVLCSFLFIIAILYFPLTLMGYLAYGTETVSPIYMNLCSGGGDCSFGQRVSVYYMYLASFLVAALSYPVILHPSELGLGRAFGYDAMRLKVWPHLPTLILRAGLVAFTVLMAILIPDFGKFLDLVSSLSSSFICYILPSMFYLKLQGDTLHPLEKALNWGVVICGFIGCFFGAYDAIDAIIEDLQDFDLCEG